MWNATIATFRENLSQIALDVQDAAEDLEIYASPDADRRVSHRFAHSNSPRLTPIPNGTDSSSNSQIEQYKAEIQRLQASEAEIKALSINYAAILKEKEEELSRLHTEHSSLRQTLEATSSGRSTSRNQSLKTLPNNSTLLKMTGEQSITKQQRHAGQVNASAARNIEHKGINPKHDASSNGALQVPSLRGEDKGLEDLLEDHSRSFTTMQATHKSEIKQLTEQLEKERKTSATIELKLQGERNLNEICQKELHSLKMDKDKISMEMKETHTELNAKISEIKRLQSELNRKGLEEPSASDETLENLITTLEKENTNLKAEKGELAAALKLSEHRRLNEASPANVDALSKHTSEDFLKLDEALKDACRKRDKALQELSRLKQHLLEKELEESEKMDEDSKTIEDLRATCEYQRAQISHLEKALKQAISSREEAKKIKSDELQKAYEVIDDLKNQLASCMRTVDSKNVELLNLQSALGQYYAETEAKDRLGRDLAAAREESARLSDSLQDAHQRLEESKSENAEILVELSQAERMASEGKQRLQKLEDDNIKVRRALEQSMTRLNRMSMDSDYFVDRRIVIKLLVTYFQRNHSKEVLDLMVRMLGFTEEDKQRIGCAQQVAGKSVVRGVLGLPGRLVGGILGGSTPEVSSPNPSGNQSFADLWVDFLLKETEERERRETAEALAAASKRALGDSPTASISTRMQSVADEQLSSTSNSPATFQSPKYSPNQMQSPLSIRGSNSQLEHLDTEFSSIPLTSSASPLLQNSSRFSRLHPR